MAGVRVLIHCTLLLHTDIWPNFRVFSLILCIYGLYGPRMTNILYDRGQMFLAMQVLPLKTTARLS